MDTDKDIIVISSDSSEGSPIVRQRIKRRVASTSSSDIDAVRRVKKKANVISSESSDEGELNISMRNVSITVSIGGEDVSTSNTKSDKKDKQGKKRAGVITSDPPRPKKQKGRGDDEVEEEDSFIQTIKSGIKSRILNGRIVAGIKQDVLVVSNFAYEYAILFRWFALEKLENGCEIIEMDFLHCLYMLLGKVKRDVKARYDPIPPDYKQIRDRLNLPLYDNTLKGNHYYFVKDQFITCVKNNVWMHGYSRVKKLFKKLSPQLPFSDLKAVLEKLFKEVEDDGESLMPQALADQLAATFAFEFNRGCFVDIKQEPLRFLGVFYEIQCLNQFEGYENFDLIPQYKRGVKHIQFDMETFHCLLRRLKLCPQIDNPTDKPKGNPRGWKSKVNIARNKLVWSDYLSMTRKEALRFKRPACGKSKAVAGSFTTNGVEICMRFNKPQYTKPLAKSTKVPDAFIGLDPGKRLFYGATKVEAKDIDTFKPYKNFTLPNKTYQHECGNQIRKKRLLRLTSDVERVIREDRDHQPECLDHKGTACYKEYAAFQLKHMAEKEEAYCKHKVTRLKFDKHIRTNKALSEEVKKLVGDSEHMEAYFGNGSSPANCPIKGYVRLPNKGFKKKLADHPKVSLISTDEFRTTKLCSICHHVNYVPKNKHRFVKCTNKECKRLKDGQKFRRVFNRDVNASNNILKNGYKRKNGQQLHANFSRGTDLDQQ